MNLIQNQRVVDISNLPPPPSSVPDPDSCESFSEWLRELTDKYGVKQKTVAEVAGLSPQAVTKWLRGGMVDAAPLARIAEWTGVGYLSLRRLLDESKIGVLPNSIAEPAVKYADSGPNTVPQDFVKSWAKLDPASRRQVLELARFLARKRPK